TASVEMTGLVPQADLVRRVRAEYLEMPGMKLTFRQVKRLWNLDDETCGRVLRLLSETRFLYRRSDGMYVLRSLDARFGRSDSRWCRRASENVSAQTQHRGAAQDSGPRAFRGSRRYGERGEQISRSGLPPPGAPRGLSFVRTPDC